MSATRENSVKYDELVGEAMADKVGTIRVSDFEFQLCDHIQKLDGEDYYATAFYEGIKAEGRDINGIYYRLLGNTPIALIPLARLKDAHPVYKDGETDAMLDRLVKTLQSLNGPVFSKEKPAEKSKAA